MAPSVSNFTTESWYRIHFQQYTNKAVANLEPIIDGEIQEWIRRAQSDWASESSNGRSIDIGKKIQFLTVDVITKICLGSALGCVADDTDKHNFLETVKQGSSICQYLAVLHELNKVLLLLTKVPFIGPCLIPKPSDKSGVGRLMGVSEPESAS